MIRSFALPLAEPLETARGTVSERRGFLFARDGVVDDRGQHALGVGEATPLPGWTESHGACRDALGEADDAVDASASGDADWDAALSACADAPAARHAVSLAKLDAAARERGVTLARLLADEYADAARPDGPAAAVSVNATVGDASPERTAAAVREAAGSGFETVKVKVGARSVAEDVQRLRAVRDSTPPDDAAPLALRADANGAWTREQAREAFDAFADVGVEYVEQPLPAADLAGHAALRGGEVAVALDESLTEHALADALEVADVVVLKPMALGGVDRALDAAVAAREAGVEPVVTTTVDAVVARTAAVHLAASIPEIPACGLATADRLAADLAADPAPVADGRVRVPDAPGHGVDATVAANSDHTGGGAGA